MNIRWFVLIASLLYWICPEKDEGAFIAAVLVLSAMTWGRKGK